MRRSFASAAPALHGGAPCPVVRLAAPSAAARRRLTLPVTRTWPRTPHPPPRIDVVDPSAFTPPYDHALCAALARAGADVRLQTSRFAYGARAGARRLRARRALLPPRRAARAGSRRRFAAKMAQHVPDMLRYRRAASGRRRRALPVARRSSRSTCTCCRARGPSSSPRTTSCRASRAPASSARSAASTSASTRSSCTPSTAARASSTRSAIDPAKVHAIEHGAFEHLTHVPDARPLPAELRRSTSPSSCASGCCARTRASTSCSTPGARWTPTPSCGSSACRAWTSPRCAPPRRRRVRWVPRFVADDELGAYFRARRPRRAALPRDRPVGRALHGARVRCAAAAQRRRRLRRGRGAGGRGARRRRATPARSRPSSGACSPSRPRAPRWARARCARRTGRYSWDAIARRSISTSTRRSQHNERRDHRARGRLLVVRGPAGLRAGRLSAAARRARAAQAPARAQPERHRPRDGCRA